MPRPKLEVADVFRRYGEAYRQKHSASLPTAHRRVMRAIQLCRTAALGGHVEVCDRCGHQRIGCNSCSDRHCPKCQSLARAQWIQDRKSELLDVPYFHVVFTVPEEIAAIALQNKRIVYSILFRATANTLQTIAADPQHLGAQIGFFAVLHTWGQTLVLHPHLHCVIPGGGLSPDQTRWISCRPHFFLPVRVLSRLFRRLFLQYLQKAFDSGKLRFSASLEALQDPQAFARYWKPVKKTNGSSMPSRPLPDPNKFCFTSAAILTASPSPTTVCSTSKTAVCVSSGKTTVITAGRRRWSFPLTSSSAGFCFMSCRRAFKESATTAFSATVTGNSSSLYAVNCWECPVSIRSLRQPTRPSMTITAISINN